MILCVKAGFIIQGESGVSWPWSCQHKKLPFLEINLKTTPRKKNAILLLHINNLNKGYNISQKYF